MQTARHALNQPMGGQELASPVNAEARRDLIVTAVFCSLAYALAASLGVLETLVTRGAGWRLNEIAAVLAILIASLGASSLVRWKALKAATLRRRGLKN
ncbi:MAG: hypothetical protein AAB225_14515 [Acidobacteriota bacterium]